MQERHTFWGGSAMQCLEHPSLSQLQTVLHRPIEVETALGSLEPPSQVSTSSTIAIAVIACQTACALLCDTCMQSCAASLAKICQVNGVGVVCNLLVCLHIVLLAKLAPDCLPAVHTSVLRKQCKATSMRMRRPAASTSIWPSVLISKQLKHALPPLPLRIGSFRPLTRKAQMPLFAFCAASETSSFWATCKVPSLSGGRASCWLRAAASGGADSTRHV